MMIKFRIYEATRNEAGGIEGIMSGSSYVEAENAKSAAEIWWQENEHSETDNTVIVATNDDGDSYHLSV